MSRLKVLLAYLKTPAGKANVHRAITAVIAIYVALHRSGV